jgi:hypothetical protein
MFVSAMYMIQYVRYSNILYCTLIRKEIQTFLIYKEIQKESVAKSNMTNGLLIYGKIWQPIPSEFPYV